MKLEEIPEEEIKDGEIVYNLGFNMADADPFKYGRLIKAGKLKEAKEMLDEKGYHVLLDNGEYM